MRMADETSRLHFLGDLSDPWVLGIAEALPAFATREDAPGPLPAALPEADVVVVHRSILPVSDRETLQSWRKQGRRVLLCIGPHVRARDLEPFGSAADALLGEATASETIARHVARVEGDPHGPRSTLPLVAVVAGGFEARRMLVEACEEAGFAARGFASFDEATPSRLAVWDAPVLERDWTEMLREPARRRSVLALIGFADRVSVSLAREAGAAACLDSPFDLDDLAFVLDRLATSSPREIPIDGPHAVPPPRMGLRVVRPPVADPKRWP
jgi:hypothetical protein